MCAHAPTEIAESECDLFIGRLQNMYTQYNKLRVQLPNFLMLLFIEYLSRTPKQKSD